MRTVIVLLLVWLAIGSANAQRLQLFNYSLQAQVSKPMSIVMDFTERYFYDLKNVKGTTVADKMADDKVFFRKGSLADIYNVNPTMSFSFSQVDRHYEVTWFKDNKSFVTIVFPAQYDLLIGQSKTMAQRNLRSVIHSAPKTEATPMDYTGIEQIEGKIWKKESETMEIASLSNAMYFQRKESDFVPVYDSAFKEYSAANLFHGLVANYDRRIYIEQFDEHLKTTGYTITLGEWLNYCRDMNLRTFFAIEEVREDGVLALVIVRSRELCFNHMLSVVIPDNFIENPNAVLKAKLTSYIPTHNLSNLYGKPSKNHKNIKWR